MPTQRFSTRPRPEANPTWTADALLELGRSYQASAVYAAAADLDLLAALADGALTAKDIARRLRCNLRGLIILLDALVGIGCRPRVEFE